MPDPTQVVWTTPTAISIGVAVIGAVVGAIGLASNFRQAHIAQQRLDLDFYNRRFNVFVAAIEYTNVVVTCDPTDEGYKDVLSKNVAFVKAQRESRFLFARDAGIYEAMARINMECQTMFGNIVTEMRRRKKEPNLLNLPNYEDDFLNGQQEAGRRLFPLMKELEEKLLAILSFEKLSHQRR